MSETVQASRAIAQGSLVSGESFPLWPPLLDGDPSSSTAEMEYPLEVVYDWDDVPASQFVQPPLPGLSRWAATLPPLAPAADLGAGGTALVRTPSLDDYIGGDVEVWVKDESRNPTWSHKDRLNTVAVSAAVHSGAAGVVVASSGNHGASAAAHAAAAGLPCVIVTSIGAPRPMAELMSAYGAVVVATETDRRWELLREVVRRYGFHAVSSPTNVPTGHPFGPEGYKTVAYEIYNQLGGAPDEIYVPSGYAELLFGIAKGFAELRRVGLCEVPRLMSCEPASRAPLARAWEAGTDAGDAPAGATAAWSIACTKAGFRGVHALRASNGAALRVEDAELAAAADAMSRCGLWPELAAAAGVAGARSAAQRRPQPTAGATPRRVVCVQTSSGGKTDTWPEQEPIWFDGRWDLIEQQLGQRPGGALPGATSSIREVQGTKEGTHA